jgi:hypothetical protein
VRFLPTEKIGICSVDIIYNEIKTANDSLALINAQLLVSNDLAAQQLKKLDEIADNSAQTAFNTQVGAFYEKRNAELTNALGFMTALTH